ncbi:MAG: type I methionyl aminopeptidase [Patescibacteria group bacterium]|nr:type I methionyl aminopeptidase [Patescibacteria group bacterium]
MINIYCEQEIAIMRHGGGILADIMGQIAKAVKPGIRTDSLDGLARKLIKQNNAEPAFLGYRGPDKKKEPAFPFALCVSVNNVVVHGLPSDYVLQLGDVVSLDLGVKYQGFYSDMALTVQLPAASSKRPVDEFEIARLIKTTKEALKEAIAKCKIGNTFGDLSFTIQDYVESRGFYVVRELCGHGIGRDLHEEPQILNFGKKGTGEKLACGMVFCLEPMVMAGKSKAKKTVDGFGFATEDNSIACHFEHAIAITKTGPLVLTKTNRVG